MVRVYKKMGGVLGGQGTLGDGRDPRGSEYTGGQEAF